VAAKDATVLIIGGGIAGLAAALSLRHYGIDSLVFERADDLRKTQVGSGLHMSYNATRAFKHLDLMDGLLPLGAPVERFEFRTSDNKHIGTTPKMEGELAIGVLRPLLHDYLATALGDDSVRAGAEFTRFEQDGAGVTAHFAGGGQARGDVLVGADGLRSVVRAQLLGDSEPRYAGYVTRRGVAESELADDGLHRNFLGSGQRFKSHPVGRGMVYWTASTNEPAGGTHTGTEIKQTVPRLFEGWPEPIGSFVSGTDESNTVFARSEGRGGGKECQVTWRPPGLSPI
jgi:2-polyprenyl-6-methoxyphenol hydroxylase-like FAD-dependent oxidoreductase